ncbi:SCP2 sterol-binding domain-containing protein [Intrasporangium calvum]|uniref:SCP2 sterol-binding domain-containing protein n=1 Tax=Intrasporangium calvum TaxID=53358 RepID=A0ABT5GKJ3_9MICO|nr:SCP2 sterol-binding domain-containing protein [Intrasporangium calvum]MDC5698546.1 SCP2 sterol-binding domain-containing protein [Intrasporangium calvum]
MTAIDLSSATPEQLQGLPADDLVSGLMSLSDRDLDALLAGTTRSEVIAAVFRAMPALFRADRAGSVALTSHWSITERPDGGSDDWTIRIADGQCTAEPGHEGTATLNLTMGPEAFTKLMTKKGNPVMMFMTGKIKAKGDLSLAANFGSYFDTPTA